ncbi:MAG: single-stranded DNA-binding protein [Rickettsiaceae bacterium]|nr:MAG: single-stranded DNA-binding protein [Rickettsiaceae bacterium]
MAYSLNKASLIGNLGKDPEIKNTKDGKEIATLVIATSDSWKDRNTGEKNEKTEWHKVVIFNENLVNVVKTRAKKGNKVYIEGALQTRKWVDDAGNDRYTTEIVLQNFNSSLIILGGGLSEGSDTYSHDKENNFDLGRGDSGKENNLAYGHDDNPRAHKRSDYNKKERNFNNSAHSNEDMDLDDEIPF